MHESFTKISSMDWDDIKNLANRMGDSYDDAAKVVKLLIHVGDIKFGFSSM